MLQFELEESVKALEQQKADLHAALHAESKKNEMLFEELDDAKKVSSRLNSQQVLVWFHQLCLQLHVAVYSGWHIFYDCAHLQSFFMSILFLFDLFTLHCSLLNLSISHIFPFSVDPLVTMLPDYF